MRLMLMCALFVSFGCGKGQSLQENVAGPTEPTEVVQPSAAPPPPVMSEWEQQARRRNELAQRSKLEGKGVLEKLGKPIACLLPTKYTVQLYYDSGLTQAVRLWYDTKIMAVYEQSTAYYKVLVSSDKYGVYNWYYVPQPALTSDVKQTRAYFDWNEPHPEINVSFSAWRDQDLVIASDIPRLCDPIVVKPDKEDIERRRKEEQEKLKREEEAKKAPKVG